MFDGKPTPASAAQTAPQAAPSPAATLAPPPGPKLVLIWNGKVSKADGKQLVRGESCVVKLESEGAAIQWLNASCGEERLYDSRTPVMGISMRNAVLGEAPHADHPGHYGYAVSFQDTGQRSGRSQIQVDSTHQQAIVFSETIPQFRVEIALDVVSQPRKGVPIYKTPERLRSITLDLSVASSTGPCPVKSGERCRLELGFANNLPTATLCSALLSCEKRWLYGKQKQPGFAACTLDAQGSPLTASDRQPPSADTTPALEVDVDKGRVTLESSEDGCRAVMNGTKNAEL
jgi:hypothetical protein